MRLPENIKDKRTTPVDCQDPAVFVCFFLTKCATHARQDQNIQYYIVSLHICSEQTGFFTNEPVIAGCFFHYIFCVLSISMCTDSPYNCFFLYGKLQIPQHSILTKMFKIDLFIIFHFFFMCRKTACKPHIFYIVRSIAMASHHQKMLNRNRRIISIHVYMVTIYSAPCQLKNQQTTYQWNPQCK